jgi:hypothetical protein
MEPEKPSKLGLECSGIERWLMRRQQYPSRHKPHRDLGTQILRSFMPH